MNRKFFKENWFVIVPGVMLLLAIPSIWPYDYFEILRWVVAGAAVYIAYTSYGKERMRWVWIMGIIAILFNPISPIHMMKEVWVVVDLIVAITFFLYAKTNHIEHELA